MSHQTVDTTTIDSQFGVPEHLEAVVRELAAQGVRRFLAFPLYPQYSLTTTKGALERAASAVERYAPGAAVERLGSWPAHPLFVEVGQRSGGAHRCCG